MELSDETENTKIQIRKILKVSNISEEQIGLISPPLEELVKVKIMKKNAEIASLKDKLVKLEAELESKFKPNKTISLTIPQTMRPSRFLDPKLDKQVDNLSITSFRPDEDDDPDIIEEMILDRKGEKLDQMIINVMKENRNIQQQIEERLNHPLQLEEIESSDDEAMFNSD